MTYNKSRYIKIDSIKLTGLLFSLCSLVLVKVFRISGASLSFLVDLNVEHLVDVVVRLGLLSDGRHLEVDLLALRLLGRSLLW